MCTDDRVAHDGTELHINRATNLDAESATHCADPTTRGTEARFETG
jgi:hypothetical protein